MKKKFLHTLVVDIFFFHLFVFFFPFKGQLSSYSLQVEDLVTFLCPVWHVDGNCSYSANIWAVMLVRQWVCIASNISKDTILQETPQISDSCNDSITFSGNFP